MTTQTSSTTAPVYAGMGGGSVCVAKHTFTVAAADTLLTFKNALPAGATVFQGWMYGADIDTGTEALDIDIGWAANADEVADPDGFGNLGVISGDTITDLKPVAGIFYPFQGVLFTAGPKTFTAKTDLTLTINAPANAGGTGALTIVALYTTE